MGRWDGARRLLTRLGMSGRPMHLEIGKDQCHCLDAVAEQTRATTGFEAETGQGAGPATCLDRPWRPFGPPMRPTNRRCACACPLVSSRQTQNSVRGRPDSSSASCARCQSAPMHMPVAESL